MLRLPPFQLHHPSTAAEAVHLRTHTDSEYLAGGTDLLVNMKHQLHRPESLIDLRGINSLRGVTVDGDTLVVGPLTPLEDAARHPDLAGHRGLVEALTSIAGPQHRAMGTLGGNVMLDTRCLFYNQTEAWREALGKCLKAEGTWCHVIGSDKACVAAQSSDSVPMLTALGATLEFLGPDGPTTIALSDLFTKDGRYDRMLSVPRSALLTAIRLPRPRPGDRSTYRKVRTRAAVDYPQLSVAVAAHFEDDLCTELQVVLGALLPSPRPMPDPSEAIGVPWTPEVVEAIGTRAFKMARPMRSIHGQPAWRRHRARVEVERAMAALAAW